MNRAAQIIKLSEADAQGLSGKNIGIAVLDTGIGYHPDLCTPKGSNRVITWKDFVNHAKKGYDDNGHGSHVAGIIAGNGAMSDGKYRGVAPQSHLVSLKVLEKNGEGHIEHVFDAIHWLLTHYQEYGIRIVNISIGSARGKQFTENSPLVKAVDALWEEGLIVLTAAGNHGPEPGSIGAPGISRKIITVGCCDPLLQKNATDYSSRGPTGNCIKKPDIVAPGSQIISCKPLSFYLPCKKGPNCYQTRSGTSMAAPIVSGSIALLLEKYPNLTNKEVKMHLKNSALDLGFEHARQGWGLLSLERFLC